MNKTEADDRLRQELRLAQLEIKVLREQLLKAVQEAQRAREELATENKDGTPRAPATPPPAATTPPQPPRVVLPMVPQKPAPSNGSAAGSTCRNGDRPCVLYVEDSEPNYRLVENVLRERPETDLLWAETGQQGLEMAREHAPQLILLDLDLPDMHGSKVLESLQAQPETGNTPVIVISADATPSQIERMLSAGARNYLTKPFDIRRFLCMFDEVLSAT